jgi:hypothetical protein
MRECNFFCQEMYFPTLPAEILAARYLESGAIGPKEPVLRPTQLPGVWQFTLAEKRILALQTTTNILAQMQSLISSQNLGSDVCISLLPPSEEVDSSFVACRWPLPRVGVGLNPQRSKVVRGRRRATERRLHLDKRSHMLPSVLRLSQPASCRQLAVARLE